MKKKLLIEIQGILEYLPTNKKLTINDYRVLLSWFTDSEQYVATHEQISERTGITRSNVSRAFAHLVKLGILEKNGKKSLGGHPVNIYRFGKIIREQTMKIHNTRLNNKQSTIANLLDVSDEYL